MITQHTRLQKFFSLFLILLIVAVFVSPLPFAKQASAQAPSDWDIIIDNSINDGAIRGEVSGIQTGEDQVTGDIVVTNTKSLWWKVYVSIGLPAGNVTIDTSNLWEDHNGLYFYLAPGGDSATDAIPTLPPSVTFNRTGAEVYFYADRTWESGQGANVLQIAEITLITITGSGVPTSVAEFFLAGMPVLWTAKVALALAEDTPSLLEVATAYSSIATDPVALIAVKELLAQLGYAMDIEQIAGYFPIFRMIKLLAIMYDMFTSPYADNVIFRAVEAEERDPVADIDCNPAYGTAPLTVNFDASGSYATEYPIESYDWVFSDGDVAAGITATHTYTSPGRHTALLIVTDSQGRQSVVGRFIMVSPPRIQVTGEDEKFRLTFEAEDSPSVLHYSWDFGDGNTAEGRVVSHTYTHAGDYDVNLTLGLDTGDTTQNWVPWMHWDAVTVVLEEDASPEGWHFTVDEYADAPETVAINGIIIEDADEVWTNTLEHSEGLDSAAQDVAPRIVVEYSDSLSEFALQGSDELDLVADVVTARIVVEYADSIAEFTLQDSAELDQLADAVAPRIVVEYADSMTEFILQGSLELDQLAGDITPMIIVEYADSLFSTILERPPFVADTCVADIGMSEGLGSDDVALIVASVNKTYDPSDPVPPIPVPGGIAGYVAEASYDGSLINMLGVRGGDYPFDDPPTFSVDNITGQSSFSTVQTKAVQQAPITVAGMIVRLVGCADDEAQLELSFAEITDGDGNLIPQDGPTGEIFIRGDAKADSDVNIADALFIAQYLVGIRDIGDGLDKVHAVNAASVKYDTGGDQINIADVLFIAQYLVGLRDCYFELAP